MSTTRTGRPKTSEVPAEVLVPTAALTVIETTSLKALRVLTVFAFGPARVTVIGWP